MCGNTCHSPRFSVSIRRVTIGRRCRLSLVRADCEPVEASWRSSIPLVRPWRSRPTRLRIPACASSVAGLLPRLSLARTAGSRPECNLSLLRYRSRERLDSESGHRRLRCASYRGKGVSAIYNESQLVRVKPGDVLVHIDPFDPYERVTAQSQTPVEIAAWLAQTGYRLSYWYGYDSVERRGWAHDEISRLAPGVNMWCGDALMPACLVYPGRTGAWGCGVVLANMTSSESRLCERLGRALEQISVTDAAPGNDPSRLTFRVIT